jgi:dynein heavy chain
VTDPWDRRCTSAYLETLLSPKLLEQKAEFALAPGLKAFAQGSFADARAHVSEKVPSDSPAHFGLHPNAEISQLIARADEVFDSILELSGAGGQSSSGSGVAAAAREAKVLQVLTELQIKLPNVRPLAEIKAKVTDRAAPYTVFLLQEIERLNFLLAELKRNLAELELGLTGALNVSDSMDALVAHLYANTVPTSWLKACGQWGPTGSYNRKPLMAWFADMGLRDKQLHEWAKDPNTLPVRARSRRGARVRLAHARRDCTLPGRAADLPRALSRLDRLLLFNPSPTAGTFRARSRACGSAGCTTRWATLPPACRSRRAPSSCRWIR